ncbi:MAG: HI0074 family nucleotidyltransferase substrate-binding subunit [Cetobacterium sp.]
MAISFSNLKNSINALEKSLNVAKGIEDKNCDLFETVRAGVIQNYEVCYESAWKSMKRWIEENDVEIDGLTRRALYIKAAENKLIDDVEKWMEFHKARNTTSHVYEVEVADEVYQVAFEYLDYAKEVLKRLEVQ